MPSIAVENLPPYEAISNEAIREAVAQHNAAKAAFDEAKKSHTQAELELPATEQLDAELAADARAAGKPEPKTRTHTAKHEQQIRDLAHELKVAAIIEQRTLDSLERALIDHGEVWAEEVAAEADARRAQWATEVDELTTLHGRLNAVLSVARAVLGPNQGSASAITFDPGAVRGREWAGGQGHTARPIVQLGDVLSALAELGQSSRLDIEPVQHPRLRPSARPEDTAESAERLEFLERAGSPEGREAAAKARRERQESHRLSTEQALQDTLSA
jgi:hypothetical protein